MKCTKCGGALAPEMKFCQSCGKKVPQQKPKKVIDLSGRLGFSVAEAALAVGVSSWLLYEEMKQGNITYSQLHGRKVIPKWALEEYIKRHEVPARAVSACE
ncbi:MAG TPA: hypothetical protein VN611_18035 [Patescibacteria group bacterium]|nr:hypothetical protein [Patescibacteria group bacterium]